MKYVLSVLILLLMGCMPSQYKPPRSPLEVREIQTRNYSGSRVRTVMKALLNVLQDEGFVTKNAVVDLGLITATKETDARSSAGVIFGSILMGRDATWAQSGVVEATVNVSEFGGEVRVRLTFQKKVLDNHGVVMTVENLEDPQFYQDFFYKLDKGIFIQNEKI